MRKSLNSWLLKAIGPRIIGILMILSGVVLNKYSIAWMLSPDVSIKNSTLLTIIFAGQAVLILAGLWFMLRRYRYQWPLVVRGLLIIGCATATVLGTYTTSLYWGWIQPPIRDLAGIGDWLRASNNSFLGTAGIKKLSREVKKVDRADKLVRVKRSLSTQLLRHGRVAEGIEHLESAYKLAVSKNMPSNLINDLRFKLGVAYIRSGEVDHCIKMHNPASCLFPLEKGGVWANPNGALKAAEYFNEYLRALPGDPGARWLLNLAYMASGNYPDGLSPDLLIPMSVNELDYGGRRFRDIAPDVGLDTFNLVGGAIMDDFDNDGFLDVITSTYDPYEPMLYYHNDGDGTFSDWSARANLTAQLGGFNLVQADYNNDGLLDILVLRGAWCGRKYGRQRNSLLRQNPNGTFTDVTKASGLGKTAYPCLAAAWADYDNDGDLDIYIGNEYLPCELFRNNGDGTFTDVARRAGVRNMANTKGVTWGDYDNDGDADLYVSNLGQPNRLYRNNGDGTFTDVAKELGVSLDDSLNRRTFAAWFWDVDNDGWLDLFVGGYPKGKVGIFAADYLGMPTSGERLRLFRNDGTGHFIDVTKKMNLYHIQWPMGANYGDIDNDGFLDCYLGTGAPGFDYLVPNAMYRNIGGTRFANITTATGVGHLQKGHAIAFGDLDRDGDQDIFAQMGGWYPADGFHNALFENPGNSNHWITIKLIGAQSNRSAIGAQIKLVVDTEANERLIYRVVGSGGSFGASSLQQEIGVGTADHIKMLEVYWPASDTRQRFNDVPVDQSIEIIEGKEVYRVLEYKPIQFVKPNIQLDVLKDD